MTITNEQNSKTMVLHIEGRLDTITSPEFERAVHALPEEITDLTLDMKEVTYVSSAGLRVLLAAQKKMGKVGSMKLTGVCESVLEVLEMTGFADILKIEQ